MWKLPGAQPRLDLARLRRTRCPPWMRLCAPSPPSCLHRVTARTLTLAQRGPQCQVGQNWGAAWPAGRDLAGIQARPGCILQGWRPQVMCSLPWGRGPAGTYSTLPSLSHVGPGLCRHPWSVCGPALCGRSWHVLSREKRRAGVSLGAAGALVSGSCRKGLTSLPRCGCWSQQC